jgi:hypothetical protein
MAKNYNKDLNIPGRAVVATAKDLKKKAVEVTLSTGVRARIKTVAASLIDRVTSRISEPEVPMEHNSDKDRDEPNPQSPKYIAAMKEYAKARGEAAIQAIVMFGVELIDPIPDKSEWLDKLQFLEKQGSLDLSKFDLDNKIDLEYLYKSLIAVGAQDLKLVMASASIPVEAMAEAEKSFPGDEGRKPDSESKVEGSA